MSLRPLWDYLQQSQALAFYVEAGYLVLASLLGGFIGAQREATNHSAGLRTHVLVCLGACLLTRIHFVNGDPGRIAAQVVTGIGFLGAGVILRRGLSVRGLTTAATVWVVAAVGISCGAGGLYAASATLATALVLFTLTVGRWSENLIHRNERQTTLTITINRHKGAVSAALTAITEAGATVSAFETEDLPDSRRMLLVTLRMRPDVKEQDVCDELNQALPDASIEWV
ncbi:MgtC/SapB family protein [Armatimonas sp.]|uniref:MgtC/SapB family protein n=1 Tax=Armatimonas sp. TaxID=1872638 RepID=UPI00286CFD35|nr:MgtC/SapB family protein [Armatimonas sp.]